MGREYITGAKFEPGDRSGSALEVLQLDMRALNKREDDDSAPGSVKITPSK